MGFNTSPELFFNMSVPTSDSEEYKPFFEEELRKIRHGLTINGIYVHGWLYWHLCHWHIYKDRKEQIDENHFDIQRVFSTPDFRDNEWLIAENILKAEQQKKGLLIFGTRRFSKTMFESSWIGRGATIYEGSENVLSSTNSDDIKVLSAALELGLGAVHPYFYFQRLADDWKKEVAFGFKDKKGKRFPWSKIYIRNLDEGRNTEILAGLTPKTLVIDEIGKANFAEAFAAGKPGFTSPYGWRCVPILTGCVCAGTKVWDNRGNLRNIEELRMEEGIVGYDGVGCSKEEISYWQEPIEKNCYKIITNKGTELECSEDHPILYRARDEHRMIPLGNGKRRGERKIYFKKIKDLIVGNQIALIEEVPIYGNLKMWEARLVGWLIGDGSYGFDKTPILSNCDEEINNYIDSNFDTVIESSYLTKSNKLYRETRIKGICHQLRKIGIYGQSRDKKTLPIDIHSYNIEDICEFLGGLWDTDGCVQYKNCPPTTFLTAAYKNILFEVKLLLQKLGIHSNIKFNKPNFKNPKDRKGCYNLYINDRKSLLRFHELVSFKIKYKQDSLNEIVKILKNRKNQIPKEVKGLRFERIVSIENIGTKPVYNLTAETTHTYIANGIVTHNTGGSFIPNSDAQKFFEEPEAQNFLAFEIPNRKKLYGLFVPGTYRMEAKIETTFGNFIQKDSGILIPEDSELNSIPFFESNEALAKAVIAEEIAQAELSKDPKPALKARMYYPLVVEDCFLTAEENQFPVEAIEQDLLFLEQQEPPQYVKLYRDNANIVRKSFDTNLKPIHEFPLDPKAIKDACIVIYEDKMMEIPPIGLYIAGSDPYNQNVSFKSPSVGTVYIFKRMYDPIGGTFQDRIVASYAARPELMKTWHENVEMLLEYYNAICMPENEAISFIQWFDQRNKINYLAEGYNLLKEISPTTSIKGRNIGLPATVKVQAYYMQLILEYTKAKIQVGQSPLTNEPIYKLGCCRIPDPLLLREMLGYSKDGNFDRIIAFGHVLAYDAYLQKYFPTVQMPNTEEEVREHEYKIRSPFLFNTKGSVFTHTSPFLPKK